MKVYFVENTGWEDIEVVAVFFSRQKAEDFAYKAKLKYQFLDVRTVFTNDEPSETNNDQKPLLQGV